MELLSVPYRYFLHKSANHPFSALPTNVPTSIRLTLR